MQSKMRCVAADPTPDAKGALELIYALKRMLVEKKK